MMVAEHHAAERLTELPVRLAMNLDIAADADPGRDRAGLARRLEPLLIVGIRIIQQKRPVKIRLSVVLHPDHSIGALRRRAVVFVALLPDAVKAEAYRIGRRRL